MRVGYAAMRLAGHVVYCLVYGIAALVLLALFLGALAVALVVAGREALP